MTAGRQLSATDLGIVLALSRAHTLGAAAQRLGLDASTVFRAVQRAEKRLGQRLFERSSAGYRATDVAVRLVMHAEAIERELEAAQNVAQSSVGELAGLVRIGAVDAVLNHILLVALAPLSRRHPRLRFELVGGNDLSNLTRREVDVVLRSTQRPPEHLIGHRVGVLRFAVYAERHWATELLGRQRSASLVQLAELPWVGIDDAMPDHPGVAWRKRHLPRLALRAQANSMLTVAAAIEARMGVGIVAQFHAAERANLVALTKPLEDCHIDLWLLTHAESRHQERIGAVARHLAQRLPTLLETTAASNKPARRRAPRRPSEWAGARRRLKE